MIEAFLTETITITRWLKEEIEDREDEDVPEIIRKLPPNAQVFELEIGDTYELYETLQKALARIEEHFLEH